MEKTKFELLFLHAKTWIKNNTLFKQKCNKKETKVRFCCLFALKFTFKELLSMGKVKAC